LLQACHHDTIVGAPDVDVGALRIRRVLRSLRLIQRLPGGVTLEADFAPFVLGNAGAFIQALEALEIDLGIG